MLLHMACCITFATHVLKLQENIGAAGWQLPEEDYDTISNLPQQRYFTGSLAMHKDGPWRNYEELWDEKDVSQPL